MTSTSTSPLPASTAGPRVPRLESLTGLRWFAAMAVFFHHAGNFSPLPAIAQEPMRIGVTGVSFFFVLSGFVLTWSFFDGDRPGRFYWRRFARIWPLHLVATLAAVPVFYAVVTDASWQRDLDLPVIALSLLLLHAWFPQPLVFFGGNPASWSLSCEAFFYACFPFLVRPVLRRRLRTLALLAAATVALMWLVLLWLRYDPPSAEVTITAVRSPLGRSLEFLLGVITAAAIRAGWRCPVGLWTSIGLLFAGLAFLAYWRLNPEIITSFRALNVMNQATAPLYALVIAASATRDLEGRASFLRWGFLVTLGKWSYAFYLIHATIIYAVRIVIPTRVPDWNNIGWDVLLLLAGIAAAGFLYTVVEHPLERRLRHMLPPLKPTPVPDAPAAPAAAAARSTPPPTQGASALPAVDRADEERRAAMEPTGP